jgi:hypothetical protein
VQSALHCSAACDAPGTRPVPSLRPCDFGRHRPHWSRAVVAHGGGPRRHPRRNASIATFNAATLADVVVHQPSASHFTSWLLSVFAATALALSVVGSYARDSGTARCDTVTFPHAARPISRPHDRSAVERIR